MTIESKLDDYMLLLKAKKQISERLATKEEEILDYFIVAGTHNIGDFVVTVEEKLSRKVNVEKIEEIQIV